MTNETFTFHEYGKQLKLGRWKRFEIGKTVAKTYKQFFGENAPKIDVKVGKEIHTVNVYPIEFKQIVDNILKQW
jgi:hypothetical protein